MISSKEVLIKVFLIFFCVTVTVIQAGVLDRRVEPITQEEEIEMWMDLIEKCGRNDLPTERDMKNLTSEEVLKIERKSKCATKCAMKILGYITEDNQLNKTAIMRKTAGMPEADSDSIEFYERCSHIKDSDSCEYAWKANECFKAVLDGPRWPFQSRSRRSKIAW